MNAVPALDAIAAAHAALDSITAALKGPEYIGSDTRQRLLKHAETVRRGLESIESTPERPA